MSCRTTVGDTTWVGQRKNQRVWRGLSRLRTNAQAATVSNRAAASDADPRVVATLDAQRERNPGAAAGTSISEPRHAWAAGPPWLAIPIARRR